MKIFAWIFSGATFTLLCNENTLLSRRLRFLWDSGWDKGWNSRWVSSFTYQEFNSVQSLSHVQLFVTPWTETRQASLSITNSQSLLKLMSTELAMPSNHLILCHLLLLPSIFPSYRVFSNESLLRIRWLKYWSFSISPSNDFLQDGLVGSPVQGTVKSLLQQYSSKASNLQRSAFFIVQLSHDYWKNHSFDKWTFLGKVMSLVYNKPSRLVIISLPRSKCLLISWL